jgi:hypothetical protein
LGGQGVADLQIRLFPKLPDALENHGPRLVKQLADGLADLIISLVRTAKTPAADEDAGFPV